MHYQLKHKTIELTDEEVKEIKELSQKKGIEIKNIDGEVIYTSTKSTLKEAVEEAVRERAYLYRANLRGADLTEANLYRADLRGANLCEANLCGACLYGANLCGADLFYCFSLHI